MKQTPREVAMGLATQAESLPKLRDKLLGIVNEINLVLNEGRNRKAPSSPFMGTGEGLTTRGTPRKRNVSGHKKKTQPKAKFLDGLPTNAVNIQGVHKSYYYVPEMGVLSLVKEGRVRLLTTPRKTGSWTVRKPNGDRYFLTRVRLRESGLEVAV